MQFKLYKALVADIIRFINRKVFNFKSVSILMYHTVGDGPESVDTAIFKEQLQLLKKDGYKVIKLTHLVELLKHNQPIPRKTVVITFDDGYVDNYTEVLPLLREFDLPATIFLATGLIGSELVNKRGVRCPMLSWTQIKEMKDSGLVEFQPHTVRHTRLSYLSDSEAESEIKNSKETIESNLGISCRVFAYPFGNYTQRDIKFINKYFDAAVTVSLGFTNSTSNILLLPRQAIDHKTSMLRFRLRI